MDYVASVPLAPKVLLLPHAFNVEPYIDEHTMRAQYAANLRVGDSYGRQQPQRETEE
jgi:hypothetical protein